MVVRLQLGLNGRIVLTRLARPAPAAPVMYTLRRRISGGRVAPEPAGPELLRLLVIVATGVGVYSLGLLMLWVACGRPDGAERRVRDTMGSQWGRQRGAGW